MTSDGAARANPLYGDNRLKLGVFALNAEVNAMTTLPERFVPTWPNSVEVARIADAAKYEALVPYARWTSFGPDEYHPSARGFENFTWAAAIAASTNHACVMSTVQVMTMHPVHAAKAMATIDHVSGGRFGLNLVVGNPIENAMFGAPAIPRGEYYDYAEEWIGVVKRLWSEDARFDFSGKYVKVAGAMLQPKPLQRPRPAIMNAARSVQGQAFVARNCDLAFVRENDRASLESQIESYRAAARAVDGRDIQIWCNCFVAQARTRAEAEAYLARVFDEFGDEAYLDTFIRIQNPAVNDLPEPQRAQMRRNLMRAVGGQQLIGDAEEIAAAMIRLSRKGVDGILLNWIEPLDGIGRFNAEVLPILEREGLRRARVG